MKHVLAVDDDPAMRAMIADYLAEYGFTVSTAAGGREMKRMLAQSPFDLLLLDVRLTDADGLDLVRELRTRSALPIIVMSGQSA